MREREEEEEGGGENPIVLGLKFDRIELQASQVDIVNSVQKGLKTMSVLDVSVNKIV